MRGTPPGSPLSALTPGMCRSSAAFSLWLSCPLPCFRTLNTACLHVWVVQVMVTLQAHVQPALLSTCLAMHRAMRQTPDPALGRSTSSTEMEVDSRTASAPAPEEEASPPGITYRVASLAQDCHICMWDLTIPDSPSLQPHARRDTSQALLHVPPVGQLILQQSAL